MRRPAKCVGASRTCWFLRPPSGLLLLTPYRPLSASWTLMEDRHAQRLLHGRSMARPGSAGPARAAHGCAGGGFPPQRLRDSQREALSQFDWPLQPICCHGGLRFRRRHPAGLNQTLSQGRAGHGEHPDRRPHRSTTSGRNTSAAASTLRASSTCATTCSIASSVPGKRLARQSGSRLKVSCTVGQ
jgi:hypothetical protein